LGETNDGGKNIGRRQYRHWRIAAATPGHANEYVVIGGGTERGIAERIAEGWLIVIDDSGPGEGPGNARRQQQLLNRLTAT
jgi:hypothetical protein